MKNQRDFFFTFYFILFYYFFSKRFLNNYFIDLIWPVLLINPNKIYVIYHSWLPPQKRVRMKEKDKWNGREVKREGKGEKIHVFNNT